jgi:hypothetical protein
VAHARGVGSAHAHSACAAHGHAGTACVRWAGLGQRGPRPCSAAHAGAVTAPARSSWRSRRWRHSGGDGANGGGRSPTTVRLPVGHGERHASSPELLVDGEEKKSGSSAASPRRGGATVAGVGPATVRRKRRVSSSSTGEERRGEKVGRRSQWRNSRRRRRGQRRRLGSDSGVWRLRTGARGHGWSGRRRCMRGSGRASGAVESGAECRARSGRAAHGPDSA